MKTPDESKCGMECIRTNVERLCIKPEKGQCPRCKQLVDESLAYIQPLESRLAQVERERDAAVQIVHGLCLHCKNGCGEGETCRECLYYPHRFVYGTGDKYVDNWQWRGVCQENTKEEGK